MPPGMKLTKIEKAWVLYDVGNSAFILLVSTLFPIYFNAIAQQAGISDIDYLAYWGYAVSAVTIIVAVSGPVLGAMTDFKGFKKPVFTASMLLGSAGCCLLGFTRHWLLFLVIFVIAKCGFSASLIFYDAMLSDVTSPERMDEVSSKGFAWGYIGSCVPFVASLGVVLGGGSLGLSMHRAAGRNDGGVCPLGTLVAGGVASFVYFLQAEALYTAAAQGCGRQLPAACRNPAASAER